MTISQTLKACRSLFRVKMAEGLQYRLSAISGLCIGVFWALIECVIYTVFFKHSNGAGMNSSAMSLDQTISYVWLAQALWVLQYMGIDDDILSKINSGDVGIELCRPMGLYELWFVKSASGKLATGWIRGLLTIVVGCLMPVGFRLGLPSSLAGFLLFVVSAVLAFLLCSAYGMVVNAVRLNITWGNGPTYMMMLFSGVLSGTCLPLRLWPDALQTILRFQPFAGATDIPVQLYIGTLSPGEALPGIGLQIAWILIWIAVGRAIMRKRLKGLIIQGG